MSTNGGLPPVGQVLDDGILGYLKCCVVLLLGLPPDLSLGQLPGAAVTTLYRGPRAQWTLTPPPIVTLWIRTG